MSINQLYPYLIIIVAGLFIGLGFARFWTSLTSVKLPKVNGQQREYYTVGELIKQKINSLFRREGSL